jgi:hypothetical protein
MKNLIKFLFVLAAGSMIFTACENDEFTEEDAMQSMQQIDLSLTITNGSTMGEPVDTATVKVIKDSKAVEKSTDSEGMVTFKDLPVGDQFNVYVSRDGYTTVVANLDLSTENYRISQVNREIQIYPLNGDDLATVTGQVDIETDLTNRESEQVSGLKVRVYNKNLTEDNTQKYYVDSTDANGEYSIKVPVGQEGSDLYVQFPDIERTQAVAVEEEGEKMIASVPTLYNSTMYTDSSAIDPVSSAYATIEEPGKVGSGLAFGTKADAKLMSNTSNIAVFEGGSGYENDTIIYFNEPGHNGDSAYVFVRVNTTPGHPDSSSIESLTINDNGAKYSFKPSISFMGLKGSGLEYEFRFETAYHVYLKNNGSNYLKLPKISAVYKDWNGGDLFREVDRNLNSNNELGGNNISNYLALKKNGKYYVNGNGDEDTLFTTKNLAKSPEITVKNNEKKQAEITLDVNNDGTIGIGDEVFGFGYDPTNPPAVTVESLADYGAGAEIEAEVGSDGKISKFELIDDGSDYVQNVNEYTVAISPHYKGFDDSQQDGYVHRNVMPGNTVYAEFDYGTGVPKED